jgi:hypothetical protein
MNRCIKRVCNCIRPDQVFKCLKVNVVSVDFHSGNVDYCMNDNKNKKKYIDNETPLSKMFPRKKSLFK